MCIRKDKLFTTQWSWCITEAWNISDSSVSFFRRTLGAKPYCRGFGTRRYPEPTISRQCYGNDVEDRWMRIYSAPSSPMLDLLLNHSQRKPLLVRKWLFHVGLHNFSVMPCSFGYILITRWEEGCLWWQTVVLMFASTPEFLNHHEAHKKDEDCDIEQQ